MDMKFYRNSDGVMMAVWDCPECTAEVRQACGEDCAAFARRAPRYPTILLCASCGISLLGEALQVIVNDGRPAEEVQA